MTGARPTPSGPCEDYPVPRRVTAELDLDLGSSVDLIFQITAAQGVPLASEQLTFSRGDRVYTPTEIIDQSGSRLHRLAGEQGPLSVRYEAVVSGASPIFSLAHHAFLPPDSSACVRCSRPNAVN